MNADRYWQLLNDALDRRVDPLVERAGAEPLADALIADPVRLAEYARLAGLLGDLAQLPPAALTFRRRVVPLRRRLVVAAAALILSGLATLLDHAPAPVCERTVATASPRDRSVAIAPCIHAFEIAVTIASADTTERWCESGGATRPTRRTHHFSLRSASTPIAYVIQTTQTRIPR